jgi:hypothetical protein
MKSLKVLTLALTISAILPLSTSYANCLRTTQIDNSFHQDSYNPINQEFLLGSKSMEPLLNRYQGGPTAVGEKPKLLLVSGLFGNLDSTGRLYLPEASNIPLIKKYIKAFRSDPSIAQDRISIPVIATEFAATNLATKIAKNAFNATALFYWDKWIETHRLEDPLTINSSHPILAGDEYVNSILSCSGKPLFKPGSSGYSIFSTLARVAVANDLDPRKLNMVEMMSIGLGHYIGSDVLESVYLQAALHYANSNQLADLESLSKRDIDNALKKFSRAYQSAKNHNEATLYLRESSQDKTPHTVHDIAVAILAEHGLPADEPYTHTTHPFSIGSVSGIAPEDNEVVDYQGPLLDYYIKNNPYNFSYRKFTGHAPLYYHSIHLPNLHDEYKKRMDLYRQGDEFKRRRDAAAKLYWSRLMESTVVSDDILDFVAKTEYAHTIKVAYFDEADKALMYFDPKNPETSRYVLLGTADEQIFAKSFDNRQAFKDWLQTDYPRGPYSKFFSLFSRFEDEGHQLSQMLQVGEEYVFDGIGNATDDNYIYTGFLHIAGGTPALTFLPIVNEDPIARSIDIRIKTSEDLAANTILNNTQLSELEKKFVETFRIAIGFVPILGQGVNAVWDAAEGASTEQILMYVGFIAFDLITAVEFSPQIFSSEIVSSKRLIEHTSEIAAAPASEFTLSAKSWPSFQDEVLDGLYHAPIRQEGGAYHSYTGDHNKPVIHMVEGDKQIILVESPTDSSVYDVVDGPYQTKVNTYYHYEKLPTTGKYIKVNRFENVSIGDAPALWLEHPKTGDTLQVVRLKGRGVLTALKEEAPGTGIYKQVDFETGLEIDDAPFVVKKDNVATEYGSDFEESDRQCVTPLRGRRSPNFSSICSAGTESRDATKRQAEIAKREHVISTYRQTPDFKVFNKLINLIKKGKAGFRELTAEEESLVNTEIHQLVTGVDDVNKVRIPFLKQMEKPNTFKYSKIPEDNLYDYLKAHQDCQGQACREVLDTINSWIHNALDKASRQTEERMPNIVYISLKDQLNSALPVSDAVLSSAPSKLTGALKDEYKVGDLVYGIRDGRGALIDESGIEGTGVEIITDTGDISRGSPVIDRYNNEVSHKVWNELEKIALPQVSLAGISNDYTFGGRSIFDATKGDVTQQIDDLVKRAFDSIKVNLDKTSSGKGLWDVYLEEQSKASSKFNLARIYQRAIELSTTSKAEAFAMYKDFRTFAYNAGDHEKGALKQFEAGSIVPTELWKKGSKLGIKLVLDSPNSKLHFVLDGLNIEEVVTKLGKGVVEGARGRGQSITASELRYLYRQRELPQFGEKVIFYKGGQIVPAPWVENPALWTEYQPRWIQLHTPEDIKFW